MAKIVLPAKMENLENLVEFVADQGRTSGFSARRTAEIRLASEEVLVNIIYYAYPETVGDISINCRSEEDVFILELLDSGIPFNMLAAPGPDIASCLSDRPVGGLGIHFVKEIASETRYVRKKGQNRLTLVFGKDRQKGVKNGSGRMGAG